MKYVASAALASFVPMASVCLVGCASLSGDGSEKQVMLSAHAVETALHPSMGYYENAVDAIYAQRYALALEYLQAARALKPDDVRVLTAFGVVYDKMGRFDLSARYYAQAAALDPQSTIVAHDVEYSRTLQGLISGPAPVLAQAAPSGQSTGASALPKVSMPPPATASLPNDNGSTANVIASAASVSGSARAEIPQDTPGKLATAPAPRQVVLAHDIDPAWTLNGSIAAPVPVLANTAPSGQMTGLPALPEGAAAKPAVVSPLNGNIPAVTPVPNRVILAHDLDYTATEHGSIPAPAPFHNNSGSPASVKVSAPLPAVVELSNKDSFTSAPMLVVAVREVDYSKVFQGRDVASTPVLAEAPALAGTGKIPAVPDVAVPQAAAVRLTTAKAGTVRPVAIAGADRIMHTTKAPRNIKAATPATGKTVSLTGHPLVLVNAAGRRDAGKVVSAYLSGRGWSVAKDIQSLPKVQAQTAIYYPASMITIAKGLTNTLSLRVRLIASPIQMGLKLVLGRDAASPVSVERLTRTQYRRIANSVPKIRSSE